MGHEFDDRDEITVDATPAQVWEAIATGPGLTSWFMGRTEVEPGEGGAVRADFGGFVQEFKVVGWEPERRLAVRADTGDDGSFVALEWLIEGRDGGSTVIRSVGSGFIGRDDWEDEYEAMTKGGAQYFHTLGQYLTYFAPRTATALTAQLPAPGERDHVWSQLRAALGLAGAVAEGDTVRLAPRGLAPIDGVIDFVNSDFLGVRTPDALYRFVCAMGMAGFGHHLFAADVDTERAAHDWHAWLTAALA